jgi:hypothetical protein
VVVAHLLPLMSTALVSPAGSRHRAECTFAPGLHSGDGTNRGWMQRHLGRGSAAWAAVSGARADPLGAECCHLAGEVLDMPYKCGAVGEWNNAPECRLGCGLKDAVHIAGRGAQVAVGLAGENGLTLGGSRLDKMLWKKSSVMSGVRLLRCLRNCYGLPSPISSISSRRMRCSLKGDSRITSSVLSVV